MKVITFVINYSTPVCDFLSVCICTIWSWENWFGVVILFLKQDNSIDMFKSSIHCDENEICDSGVKPFTSNCNFYT